MSASGRKRTYVASVNCARRLLIYGLTGGKRRKWLIGLQTRQLRLCLEKERVEVLRCARLLALRAIAPGLCPLCAQQFPRLATSCLSPLAGLEAPAKIAGGSYWHWALCDPQYWGLPAPRELPQLLHLRRSHEAPSNGGASPFSPRPGSNVRFRRFGQLDAFLACHLHPSGHFFTAPGAATAGFGTSGHFRVVTHRGTRVSAGRAHSRAGPAYEAMNVRAPKHRVCACATNVGAGR